jgi:hypothetical protein
MGLGGRMPGGGGADATSLIGQLAGAGATADRFGLCLGQVVRLVAAILK